MNEREFDDFIARAGAVAEGSRFTAYIAVQARNGKGFPVYYAICENRSFRSREPAEAAAIKALAAVETLEADGTPVFPEDYDGFDAPDDRSDDDANPSS